MKYRILNRLLFATLVTVSLLSGCATTPVLFLDRVYRMEIRTDELGYSGPDLRSRMENNWTDKAKKSYRWAFPIMINGTGSSAEIVAITGALVGEGVPILEKGDVVDVFWSSGPINYEEGVAPIILRRICSHQDDACLADLRKVQGGKISGIRIDGVYLFPHARKISPPLKNYDCVMPSMGLVYGHGCHAELPDPA